MPAGMTARHSVGKGAPSDDGRHALELQLHS